MKSNDPAISLNNVWVKYNSHVVLKEINLTVDKKEIITIVGPNGSGKTTLLRTIMGFKETSKGTVRILQQKPKKALRNGIFGYLPQNENLDKSFPVDVFDVVAMSRFSQKGFLERLTETDKNIIHESLEKVEMKPQIHTHFGNLSGGQQQRVLIARALASNPKILILDEPSTGLDAVAQDRFYQLLVKIRDHEKLTIIMVSHDIGAVSSIVDKVACLNKRIHFHGSPEGCLDQENVEKVFGKNVNFLLHDKNCETCLQEKSCKKKYKK